MCAEVSVLKWTLKLCTIGCTKMTPKRVFLCHFRASGTETIGKTRGYFAISDQIYIKHQKQWFFLVHLHCLAEAQRMARARGGCGGRHPPTNRTQDTHILWSLDQITHQNGVFSVNLSHFCDKIIKKRGFFA